jgi:DNA-binding NarL/FixJ family response regulator
MEYGESTVLIADADESARTSLARVLRAAGYRVLQSDTGDGALALARSSEPDAVILEVPLPGLSGYEVCHALKCELGALVPVVFLSGARTEAYDRIAGLLLGADDYVVKPYAAGEVLARLTNLIRRSRSQGSGAAHSLTKREQEVLNLMGAGLRQQEIARRLFISPKTVATHVEHILRKFDVGSMAEAVAVAFQEEILRPHVPRAAATGKGRRIVHAAG